MRTTRGISRTGALAAMFWLALSVTPSPAAEEENVFARLAADFRATVARQAPELAACAGGAKARVGVLPFDPARAPLPAVALGRIYNDMLAQLTAAPAGCMEFLDAESMRAVLRHLRQTGRYDASGESLLKALRKTEAAVDLLLVGKISAAAGEFYLDYRLIERRTGKLLARVRGRRLPAAYVDVTSADAALPPEKALEAAARELLAQAASMKALAVDGVYFQETRRQTSGGLYLRDKLRDKLVRAYANPITGKALKLVGKPTDGGDESLYVLMGRYRIMGGDAIDLTVTMKNAAGRAASWSGLVRITALEGLRWRPQEEAPRTQPGAPAAARRESAFAFELIADHGREAVYAPGEELRLRLRLARTAYVYCYFTGERGETASLIPNPRWIAASGRRSYRVKRYRAATLPQPERDGFSFRINRRAAGGEVLVRCYATSRDITTELPAQMRGTTAALIPPEMARRLDAVFLGLKGLKLARAAIKIRIAGEERR